MYSLPLPAELIEAQRWLAWRFVERDSGKPGKIPYNIQTGQKANVTDRRNWFPFEEAIQAVEAGCFDGIGFATPADSNIFGIDLDSCFDAGKLRPGAKTVIEQVNSYSEMSISATGLHIYGAGEPLAELGKRILPCGTVVEFAPRYFTVSGVHWPGSPRNLTQDQQVQETLRRMFAKDTQKQEIAPVSVCQVVRLPQMSDKALLTRARNAKNKATFNYLWEGRWQLLGKYPSQSEADLALCRHLAWWLLARTEPEDLADRIDRLFRQSGLYRAKWERADYRNVTTVKAIASVYAGGRFYGSTKTEKPQRTDSLSVARFFLTETLASGALPANEVLRLSDEADIAPATLNRAKEGLAESYQAGRGNWHWRLISSVSKQQAQTLGTQSDYQNPIQEHRGSGGTPVGTVKSTEKESLRSVPAKPGRISPKRTQPSQSASRVKRGKPNNASHADRLAEQALADWRGDFHYNKVVRLMASGQLPDWKYLPGQDLLYVVCIPDDIDSRLIVWL